MINEMAHAYACRLFCNSHNTRLYTVLVWRAKTQHLNQRLERKDEESGTKQQQQQQSSVSLVRANLAAGD